MRSWPWAGGIYKAGTHNNGGHISTHMAQFLMFPSSLQSVCNHGNISCKLCTLNIYNKMSYSRCMPVIPYPNNYYFIMQHERDYEPCYLGNTAHNLSHVAIDV